MGVTHDSARSNRRLRVRSRGNSNREVALNLDTIHSIVQQVHVQLTFVSSVSIVLRSACPENMIHITETDLRTDSMGRQSRTSSPTLRQLELLLSLTSSDAIAGAGAKIGMSPSATSHALRALETALGTELIDRNASGVVLTHTGEQVLPHVRDVFASLQLVQATALAGAELKTGLLRLGSFGASATTRVLPPLIDRFKARYPGVDVVVTEKADEQTSRDLTERRLELAAITLPKPGFDSQTLAVDELVAVLPSGHPLARLETVPLKELTVDPFILTRAGSQSLVTRLFSRHGLRPRVTYELLQLMSILELVAHGKGMSVLARLALPDRYSGATFRPIAPGTSRRIGLVCLNERRLSPVARAFWQETRRYQASLKRG